MGYGSIVVVVCENPRRYLPTRSHVVALLLDGRPVPAGKEGCHSCGVRLCCNPAHLYVGTRQNNIDDAVAAGVVPKGTRHWNYKHGRYACA
jgi:hypothetical protein